MDTQYGKVHCTMTGTPRANRPVILTFHDIGLNRKSQLLDPAVCVLHIKTLYVSGRRLKTKAKNGA